MGQDEKGWTDEVEERVGDGWDNRRKLRKECMDGLKKWKSGGTWDGLK